MYLIPTRLLLDPVEAWALILTLLVLSCITLWLLTRRPRHRFQDGGGPGPHEPRRRYLTRRVSRIVTRLPQSGPARRGHRHTAA